MSGIGTLPTSTIDLQAIPVLFAQLAPVTVIEWNDYLPWLLAATYPAVNSLPMALTPRTTTPTS